MKTTKIIEIDGDKFAAALTDADLLQLIGLLIRAGLKKVESGYIPSADSRYDTTVHYSRQDQVDIKISFTGSEVITREEYDARRTKGEQEYEAAQAVAAQKKAAA